MEMGHCSRDPSFGFCPPPKAMSIGRWLGVWRSGSGGVWLFGIPVFFWSMCVTEMGGIPISWIFFFIYVTEHNPILKESMKFSHAAVSKLADFAAPLRIATHYGMFVC